MIYRTPGGKPPVAEWHKLDEQELGNTLRNITACKIRPPPPLPVRLAAINAINAASASANFEKGTRRSVSDYKIFRDCKTWNQFQRGLLATAHMHGVVISLIRP
jgi:hypothetical protein